MKVFCCLIFSNATHVPNKSQYLPLIGHSPPIKLIMIIKSLDGGATIILLHYLCGRYYPRVVVLLGGTGTSLTHSPTWKTTYGRRQKINPISSDGLDWIQTVIKRAASVGCWDGRQFSAGIVTFSRTLLSCGDKTVWAQRADVILSAF